MFKNIFLLVTAFCLALFYQSALAQENRTTFYESKNVIANPERGMFAYDDDRQGEMQLLDEDYLRQKRMDECLTVVYRHYSLSKFRERDLKPEYLDFLNNDLAIARKAGVKLILRFAYTDSEEANTPDIEDCKKPNDKDATSAQIMKHLTQLKNYFESGKDVILMVEAGFIGAYGEWYYTRSEFGMCPNPNYPKRAALLKNILDTIPSPIPVMLRTPFYIENILSVWKSAGMPAADIAKLRNRLGIHNDCFSGDANDMGTFRGEKDRQYAKEQTKIVSMVGESCNPLVSNEYAGWVKVEAAATDYHWSLISSTDDGWLWRSGKICANSVGAIKDCENGKCKDGQQCKPFSRWTEEQVKTFKQKLGYRIMLSSSWIPAKIKHGEPLNIKLAFHNVGWARPFNNRPIELFLCPKNMACRDVNKGFALVKNQDFRDWLPSSQNTESISFLSTIPTVGLPSGEYDIYLNLPDPVLSNNPAYSVRLANWPDGVINSQSVNNIFSWTDKGYNRFASIIIQ